jgi:RNA polymerase sigma-70 factor (ECF subfamily)
MKATESGGPDTRTARGGVAEHELVERCRQGDETAFRELVDQYKGIVFALIARTISDRARAEEVAQDVFLRVHKGLPYFRGESKLSTWIFRIAANVLSQEKRLPLTLSLDDPEGPPAPATHDRTFGDVMLKDRLEKAIARLPLSYQILVNGHYLKGMQYEELAQSLEIPMGTVKTHLHRAKRQLRLLLETEFR